jgi:23S rRNA (cytidine2498-2'-O)-methyltransferase
MTTKKPTVPVRRKPPAVAKAAPKLTPKTPPKVIAKVVADVAEQIHANAAKRIDTNTASHSLSGVLAYCRAGFEPDLLAEMVQYVGVAPRTVRAKPLSAFVHAEFPPNAAKRVEAMVRESLIFARQRLYADAAPITMGLKDRVTPIVDAALAFLASRSIVNVSDVWVEYPDTNDGKELSKLSQALEARVAFIFGERRMMSAQSPWRLHVMLTGKQEAYVACARIDDASSWRLGIPRLRMPHDAPSRSTLKLLEAIHTFLGENAERMLMPEMRAVDLGAAPGGWTWQLVHRGLHVTAVDNGAMRGELTDNALVRHLREDGFKFKPKKPVDWLVCDMVESPSRIAKLVGQWIGEGMARHAIFNLKLPMKKRLEEVERCSQIILDIAGPLQPRLDLRFKHLYHDREEVTGYCGITPRVR